MTATVDIAMTTWPTSLQRLLYLCQTIDSLRANLADSCTYRWICSGETERGGELWFGEEVADVCGLAGIELVWRPVPANLGNSINELFARSVSDYVLVVQDDRPLVRPLDLSYGIALLRQYPRVAAIWYDWLPFGNGSYGKVGDFWFSSPVSTWVIADRQMLVRRTFLERYGKYLMDAEHGAAEMDMNRRLKRFSAMVAHPPEVYFEHVGKVRSV